MLFTRYYKKHSKVR